MSEEVKYICPKSPSLVIKLCGKRMKAVNGVLEGLTAAQMKELDELLKTRPHIRQEIRRVDLEEAAKKAKEFMAAQQPAAVQGVVTSATSAANKLREARQGQTPENLTGKINPVNVTTNKKSDKPLEVEQVPTSPPKKPFLGGMTK